LKKKTIKSAISAAVGSGAVHNLGQKVFPTAASLFVGRESEYFGWGGEIQLAENTLVFSTENVFPRMSSETPNFPALWWACQKFKRGAIDSRVQLFFCSQVKFAMSIITVLLWFQQTDFLTQETQEKKFGNILYQMVTGNRASCYYFRSFLVFFSLKIALFIIALWANECPNFHKSLSDDNKNWKHHYICV
jgi:hypothetical protein